MLTQEEQRTIRAAMSDTPFGANIQPKYDEELTAAGVAEWIKALSVKLRAHSLEADARATQLTDLKADVAAFRRVLGIVQPVGHGG